MGAWRVSAHSGFGAGFRRGRERRVGGGRRRAAGCVINDRFRRAALDPPRQTISTPEELVGLNSTRRLNRGHSILKCRSEGRVMLDEQSSNRGARLPVPAVSDNDAHFPSVQVFDLPPVTFPVGNVELGPIASAQEMREALTWCEDVVIWQLISSSSSGYHQRSLWS